MLFKNIYAITAQSPLLVHKTNIPIPKGITRKTANKPRVGQTMTTKKHRECFPDVISLKLARRFSTLSILAPAAGRATC